MKSINKGDDLFELIFELDRRLQSAQTRQSPLQNSLETFKYLEVILEQVQDKNFDSDLVDTIFLKLIDFFIKCNCNYKRIFTSKFLQSSSSSLKLKLSKNSIEASLKRICSLWDFSVSSDFETCNQILNLLNSCSSIFYAQPTIYGIFFESFSDDFLDDSEILISATLNCFEKLFEDLKVKVLLESDNNPNDDSFIKNSNFSALIIQNSQISKYFDHETLRRDSYKIILLTSIISGRKIHEFPYDIRIQFSDLYSMLS